MKVTETKTKEFKPYKVSIKINGEGFYLEYWVRKTYISFDSSDDFVAHSEEFKTLEEAVERFNEVIEEIK